MVVTLSRSGTLRKRDFAHLDVRFIPMDAPLNWIDNLVRRACMRPARFRCFNRWLVAPGQEFDGATELTISVVSRRPSAIFSHKSSASNSAPSSEGSRRTVVRFTKEVPR